MREESDTFEALGVSVLAIGGSAGHQAAALQHDFPFPLLLDPDQVVRRAVGLGTLTIRQMLSPRSGWRYVRSIRSRVAPGKITKDREQAPGVVLTNAALDVEWTYKGSGLGDYPPIQMVRDRIARIQ